MALAAEPGLISGALMGSAKAMLAIPTRSSIVPTIFILMLQTLGTKVAQLDLPVNAQSEQQFRIRFLGESWQSSRSSNGWANYR